MVAFGASRKSLAPRAGFVHQYTKVFRQCGRIMAEFAPVSACFACLKHMGDVLLLTQIDCTNVRFVIHFIVYEAYRASQIELHA